ncbi:MAG: ATP-binding protein [Spirochaetales bacterium]
MHYTIGDYIEDLVQNSLEAGSPFTSIKVEEANGFLEVRVEDTGKGMTEEELSRALDPYGTDPSKHPGRKVGLGLPFLLHCVQTVGGEFHIQSAPGKGTTVFFRIPLNHIDSPPLTNLTETFLQILTYPGNHEIRIDRSRESESYTLHRSELRETLEDLESVGSQALLKEYIQSLETSLEAQKVS